MQLTKTAVDRLQYGIDPDKDAEDKRQIKPGAMWVVWDDTTEGLGVRVYPSGKKSFLVGYTVRGRKRFLTIGKYGAMTLDRARKEAKKKLGKVAEGADPGEDKKQAQRAETMARFASKYITDHAQLKKRSWKEDERRITKYIIPAFGTRTLESITNADAARLHTQIGKTRRKRTGKDGKVVELPPAKYEANRVLSLLGVMFTMARKWGDVPRGFINPAADIDKFPEKSRDVWVTPEHLPALWKAIEAEPDIYVRGFFMLELLVGTRKNELLGAKWEQIDFERGELLLPNTKSGDAQVVELPPEAIDILRSLRAQKALSYYVFPSPVNPGAPRKVVLRQLKRIRVAAKLPDITLHDLRRTVGSWMASSGESLHIIGKVMRHRNAEVTRVYARLASSVTRKAIEKHASAIVAAGLKQ